MDRGREMVVEMGILALNATSPPAADWLGVRISFTELPPAPDVTGNEIADQVLNVVPITRILGGFGRAGRQFLDGDYYGAGRALAEPEAEVAGIALGVGLGGRPRGGKGFVQAGEAGRFAGLDAGAAVGDGLNGHHPPQKALRFISEADGGDLMMTTVEHDATRTFGARGRLTARQNAGAPLRQTRARDIRDVRRIVGPKYDAGIRQLLDYYYDDFPHLMK